MSPSERSVGRRTPSRGPCGSRPGRPTFGWCPGSRVRRGGRGPSRQPRCRPSIRAAWQIAATGSADSKNGVGRQSGGSGTGGGLPGSGGGGAGSGGAPPGSGCPGSRGTGSGDVGVGPGPSGSGSVVRSIRLTSFRVGFGYVLRLPGPARVKPVRARWCGRSSTAAWSRSAPGPAIAATDLRAEAPVPPRRRRRGGAGLAGCAPRLRYPRGTADRTDPGDRCASPSPHGPALRRARRRQVGHRVRLPRPCRHRRPGAGPVSWPTAYVPGFPHSGPSP